MPLAFWRREVLWRLPPEHGVFPTAFGSYRFSTLTGLMPGRQTRPSSLGSPIIAPRIARDRDARAFLFWSRMPVAEFDPGPPFDGTRKAVTLRDQRFMNNIAGRTFEVRLEP